MHHYQVSSKLFLVMILWLTYDGYSIESFNMTAGNTLALTGLASGTTVNLMGEVTFGVEFVHDAAMQ